MNIFKQLIAITTGVISLITANSVQAFTVISGEDINVGIYRKEGVYYSYNQSQELEALSQSENNARNIEADFLTYVNTKGIEDFETYDLIDSGNQYSGTGDFRQFDPEEEKIFGGVSSLSGVGYIDYKPSYSEVGDGTYLIVPGWLPRFEGESASSTFSLDLAEDVSAISFYGYGLGNCGELEVNLYNDGVLVRNISNETDSLYTENESVCHTDFMLMSKGVPQPLHENFDLVASEVFIGIMGDLKEDDTYETFDRVEFVTKGKNNMYQESHLYFDNLRIGNVQKSTNIFAD